MLFLDPPLKTATYKLPDGAAFTLTLKRPSYAHALELKAFMFDAQAALGRLYALTATSSHEETSAVARDFILAMPADLVERLFAEYVSNVEGFSDDSGPRILTGPELLAAVPDYDLTTWVVGQLIGMCSLGKVQRRPSSSASTLPLEAASTRSPATPTDAEECTKASTATETSHASDPSSEAV